MRLERPRARSAPLLATLLVACAGSHPRAPHSAALEARARAALEAATPLAERCLRAGDRVTVDGLFDGPTGTFLVERIGAASPDTPERVRQCVAGALERARIPPFGPRRHAARWTVATRTITPEVLALLDAGAAPPPSPAVLAEADFRAVSRVVQGEAREARACYEDALRERPSLAGTLEIRLSISVDGRVIEAHAHGPAALRPVGHCVLARLRQLDYPPPRGGVVDFVYRFELTPNPHPP